MISKISYQGTIARWLPKDPAVIQKYQSDLIANLIHNGVLTRAGDVDEIQLSFVILEFKKLIEEDPAIFRDFHEMFTQVPPPVDAAEYSIKTYMQLLAVLNKIITAAPTFTNHPLVSGVPMYGVLAPFCNTEAGYRAFTNAKVNAMFHKIFDEWTRFLVSPASRNVLTTEANGWFGPEALGVQELRLGMKLEDAWVCDPAKPNWGFTSWDNFFVRRFREGVRPTVNPDDSKFINVACEAITYRFVTDVQATDQFWLKGLPYSLQHILNYDPLASQLVGGKVFQAMLSSLDYHRWHSPVDGRVVKTYVVPGTYYAAPPDDKTDPDVISRSQAFVTAMAARALIFIESDNPDIGLMCFVGVGLGEVSTTKLEVKEGDRLKKGDELGSFHFGGSTHLLVFRRETELTLLDHVEFENPEDQSAEARKVGTLLFRVTNQ